MEISTGLATASATESEIALGESAGLGLAKTASWTALMGDSGSSGASGCSAAASAAAAASGGSPPSGFGGDAFFLAYTSMMLNSSAPVGRTSALASSSRLVTARPPPREPWAGRSKCPSPKPSPKGLFFLEAVAAASSNSIFLADLDGDLALPGVCFLGVVFLDDEPPAARGEAMGDFAGVWRAEWVGDLTSWSDGTKSDTTLVTRSASTLSLGDMTPEMLSSIDPDGDRLLAGDHNGDLALLGLWVGESESKVVAPWSCWCSASVASMASSASLSAANARSSCRASKSLSSSSLAAAARPPSGEPLGDSLAGDDILDDRGVMWGEKANSES